MKTTEFINNLRLIVDEHGDLDIYYADSAHVTDAPPEATVEAAKPERGGGNILAIGY